MNSLLRGIRLILFDLDGTIVDSEDFIVWSFVEAGRLTGIRVDPLKVRELIGFPLESILEAVVGTGLSREDAARFIEVRRKLVQENWFKHVRLFPDVIPVLRQLSSTGYMLGVASSSIRERVELFLSHLGVSGYFKVVSGLEPGVKGKPEPDVIVNALKAAGVPRSEALYVGDRMVDCIAARRAGVKVVIVDRGSVNRWKQEECVPDAWISSLLELVDDASTPTREATRHD
ncbi:HAD family hydrolase [Desulfurococcus mucosus]|uniref:HAD-superfamily hydrolase, subfamily IA, variant 1 n=1 Tax=Desulfurococcus mucosus (strain ATCC 35584 / DSM 2162 / JCM 9187 / O7/1) TaxID=765177 RepID=E8RAH2_DESM0|nr:HAD-IA family hydrolase [Desulfurococcus mucosus]ADV64382.1 HAD-superfamily hydrolase, subfamily IA, variant 1 [Desulfurococcus mucosus DSM 2162]